MTSQPRAASCHPSVSLSDPRKTAITTNSHEFSNQTDDKTTRPVILSPVWHHPGHQGASSAELSQPTTPSESRTTTSPATRPPGHPRTPARSSPAAHAHRDQLPPTRPAGSLTFARIRLPREDPGPTARTAIHPDHEPGPSPADPP